MPSNTTLLFHQSTFKAYYLCQTFLEVVRVLDRSDINYQGLLLFIQHFAGINNIKAAWEEVSLKCLN